MAKTVHLFFGFDSHLQSLKFFSDFSGEGQKMVQIYSDKIFLAIIDRFIKCIFKVQTSPFSIPDDSVAIAHKDQISEMVDTLKRSHLGGDPLIKDKHDEISSFV